MKVLALIISLFFFSVGTVQADGFFSYLFSGKWNPSEEPLLIGQNGFQDIQNLRYFQNHLRGVKGDLKISETSANTPYYRPRSAYHFTKDNPTETHIIAQFFNEDLDESILSQNITPPPNAGEFSGTTLHQDAPGSKVGSFATVSGGNLAYANGEEALIWGGNERPVHGFLLGIEQAADYWEEVRLNSSNTFVSMSGETTFYIGSTRRIDRFKVYVKTANATAGSLVVRLYNGTAWTDASNVSDGTASGGIPLAATGTVTIDYSLNARTTFVKDFDHLLYWYEISVTNVDSSTEIYYVSVGEGEFRSLEDIWDGVNVNVFVWQGSGSGTTNYTDATQGEPPIQEDYMELDAFSATTEYILVQSFTKLRGLEIKMVSLFGNTNAAVTGVSFFNGVEYSGVTGLKDRTAGESGVSSLSKDGIVHWLPTEEWGSTGVSESGVSGFGIVSMYSYRLSWNARLSDKVRIYYIRGIPAQPARGDLKDFEGYRFVVFYQGRLLLGGGKERGNSIRYSAFEKPDVFNGNDSDYLNFGGDEDLVNAAPLYNVYRTSGVDQLIVGKTSEAYRLSGDGIENWNIQLMDSNIGVASFSSMSVGGVIDVGEGVLRNVITWQASHGMVATDGATIGNLSDDVSVYWDVDDSRGMSPHQIDDTNTWYNPHTNRLTVAISSGSESDDTWADGDTWKDPTHVKWGVDVENQILTHNVELEYDFKKGKWTKLYRENADGTRPLQVGFQVRDSDGTIYLYGLDDDGFMYRLEYGSSWDGTDIDQYVRTKDFLLGEQPFRQHTVLRYHRLSYVNKSILSGETIAVTHWGDDVQTVSGVSFQKVPENIDTSDSFFDTQDVVLGPFLTHSFMYRSSIGSVDQGMELTGLGIFFDTKKRIIE